MVFTLHSFLQSQSPHLMTALKLTSCCGLSFTLPHSKQTKQIWVEHHAFLPPVNSSASSQPIPISKCQLATLRIILYLEPPGTTPSRTPEFLPGNTGSMHSQEPESAAEIQEQNIHSSKTRTLINIWKFQLSKTLMPRLQHKNSNSQKKIYLQTSIAYHSMHWEVQHSLSQHSLGSAAQLKHRTRHRPKTSFV